MSQLFVAVRTLQGAFRAASRRRRFRALRESLRLLEDNREFCGILCAGQGEGLRVRLKLEGETYPPRVVYAFRPSGEYSRAEFPFLAGPAEGCVAGPPGEPRGAPEAPGRESDPGSRPRDESLTLSDAAPHRVGLGYFPARVATPEYRPLFDFFADQPKAVPCQPLDLQDPVHRALERALLSSPAERRQRPNRKLARRAAGMRSMLGLSRTSPLGGPPAEREDGAELPSWEGPRSRAGSLEGSLGRDGLNASLSSFLSRLKTATLGGSDSHLEERDGLDSLGGLSGEGEPGDREERLPPFARLQLPGDVLDAGQEGCDPALRELLQSIDDLPLTLD